MGPNGTKWDQMGSNGTKRDQMGPNGTKWDQMGPIATKIDKLNEIRENLPLESCGLKERIHIQLGLAFSFQSFATNDLLYFRMAI